ncbi:hypothetical protein ATE84_2008 [Aquimarina sp. MAR_2010_214]|uniref:hypothetical protein n=1 Tax=Aquimarina sp. MAR_2010_214 TaxID=1250026 RepID=UPI000C704D00|nr:hypothetical protein [Aquimarina sp. MAR_2010_214]PKV49962.1 hypothetical protein ATE84_2008 [Aquimarina sp. MAR_2010_214]
MVEPFGNFIKHSLPVSHWVLGFYELHLQRDDQPIFFLPSSFSYVFVIYGDTIEINCKKKNEIVKGVVIIPLKDDLLSIKSKGKTKLLIAKCTSLSFSSLASNQNIDLNETIFLPCNLDLSWDILEPQYYVRKYLEELYYGEQTILISHVLRYINDKKGLVTVDEIVKRYSYSIYFLKFQFKKYLKTTPQEFLNKTKLFYCANELIKRPNDHLIFNRFGYSGFLGFKQNFMSMIGVEFEKILNCNIIELD